MPSERSPDADEPARMEQVGQGEPSRGTSGEHPIPGVALPDSLERRRRSTLRFRKPTTEQLDCIRTFNNALQDGTAALFLGAGISRAAGFLDWRGCLRDIAAEIGLDIDLETDLPSVVQYHLNQRGHDRSRLNQIITNAFGRYAELTENHRILARLPVSTIWTTNYDALIEKAIEGAGKVPDVRRRDVDFSIVRPSRDVVVNKLHGDITAPDQVVISSDDYERYATDHALFQRALEGDLVTKTFLFVGFSFTDPNLRYVLGHLRALLRDNKREHFAVFRRARLDVHAASREAAEADFAYRERKQRLQIEDLKRYGIRTILVDHFDEVTTLLSELERSYYWRHVFVSGSANTFAPAFDEDRMRQFCMLLGEQLIRQRYNIVTGLGLNIGDAILKGALLELIAKRVRSIEKRLCLRPFPRSLPPGHDEVEYNQRYRFDMIVRSNFALFVAGTSRTHRISTGVMEEYALACSNGLIPIPVGATGFAANLIWRDVARKLDDVFDGKVPMPLFQRLNDASLPNEEIVDSIFQIMRKTPRALDPMVWADDC